MSARCGPELHDGQLVDADYLVSAAHVTSDKFAHPTTFEPLTDRDARHYACCSAHLDHAVACVLLASGSNYVIVRQEKR